MVTYVTIPKAQTAPQMSVVLPEDQARAPTSTRSTKPVWQTIIKVVLTIVIIAAVVIAGRILIPKLINFVSASATAAADVVDLGTETAKTVSAIAKGAKHVLFDPIAYDIIGAVDAVATSVNAVTNGLFINTVEAAAAASSVVGTTPAILTFLPWMLLTAPKL